MKLEGSLDAFGLPDIFQLLSYTKKTGGLHLSHAAESGVVYFTGGSVTGACSDRRRQTLARRLIGTGAVGDDALAQAVQQARTGDLGVSRALLDAGAVDGQVLARAAAEQLVDAVADLLGWPEGDFAFSVDEPNPDDVGVALPTERVVSAALAQRETAAQVTTRIPGPDLVLAMPITPPAERDLTGEEWALVALADGRRSVADIADLTGSGYWTVAQALADLSDRGLLHAPGEDDHATAVRRRLALLASLEEGDPGSSASRGPDGGPAVAADAATPDASGDPGPHPSRPDGPASAPDRVSAQTVTAPEPAGAPVSEPALARAGSFVPVTATRVAPAAPSTPGGGSDRSSQPTPAPASGAVPTEGAPERSSVAGPSARPSQSADPGSPGADQPRSEPVRTIGGPHVPRDVVPPRPEPFQPPREVDHPEPAPPAMTRPAFASAAASAGPGRPGAAMAGPSVSGGASLGEVNGSVAMAPKPDSPVIERDPSVNRSLLLRLIAGVRGL